MPKGGKGDVVGQRQRRREREQAKKRAAQQVQLDRPANIKRARAYAAAPVSLESPIECPIRSQTAVTYSPQSTSAFANMGEQPLAAPPQPGPDANRAALMASIFLPAEPFDLNGPPLLRGDEFLREVLANLENHNDKVRANIIALSSAPTRDLKDELDRAVNNSPRQETRSAKKARFDRLLSNLEAPYRTGDPPPVAQQIKSTFTQPSKLLEEYSRNARKGLEHYRHALNRRGSIVGSGDDESRRSSMADGSMVWSPLSRRENLNVLRGGADVVMGGVDDVPPPAPPTEPPPPPLAAQSSGYDYSRDPRLAGRR